MRLADLSNLAAKLDGVGERRRDGLLEWRYRGRLVARQLDRNHIVSRACEQMIREAKAKQGAGQSLVLVAIDTTGYPEGFRTAVAAGCQSAPQ